MERASRNLLIIDKIKLSPRNTIFFIKHNLRTVYCNYFYLFIMKIVNCIACFIKKKVTRLFPLIVHSVKTSRKLLKNEVDRNTSRWGRSGINLKKIVYLYSRVHTAALVVRKAKCIPGKCNPRWLRAIRSEGTGSILLDCSASFPTASLSRRPENVDLRRLPSRVITICLLPSLTTDLKTCFFLFFK